MFYSKSILLGFVIVLADAYKRGQQVEPPPKVINPGHYVVDNNEEKYIENRISSWEPNEETNPWEMSGLIEGDILPSSGLGRNGLRDEDYRWKDGVIPYYISELEFKDEDIEVVMDAIKEYHNRTCIRFRPYKLTDRDFVIVRSNSPGCWSAVGRQKGGQVVNLQTPGCNHRGVVIHEFLHALGFFHQQSASERDDFVKIHWENIQDGREHNFDKYNETIVTSYEEKYDYDSIMHYSSKAFSKNGEVTIEPLTDDAKIGQRKHLSEKDVIKLNAMYEKECENRKNQKEPEQFSLLNWIMEL